MAGAYWIHEDLAKAQKWAKKSGGARIVAIDLDQVEKTGAKIYDLTDEAVRNSYLRSRWAKNFAKGMKEVVIEGFIPPEAILWCITFGR